MATHLPTAQNRLRVYTDTPGGRHSTYFHYGEAVTPADAVTGARAILTAIRNLMATTTQWSGADWIPAGSNIGNSVTWGATITGNSGNSQAAGQDPYYVCIAGRDVTGCRTRLFFWGFQPTTDNNWRIESAESTIVAGLVTALNSTIPTPCTLTGDIPVWKTYVTIGANRHHIRRRHSLGG